MSVPVNQRTAGELDVNVKARVLCTYTLKITANPKHFPPEQNSFTEKIRDAAIDIYTMCWEANNIRVDNRMDRYLRRIELQELAADKCNTLCVLIELAKPLFKLSSKRCMFWIDMVVKLRAEIRAWTSSDLKRLKPSEKGT